MRLSMLRLLVAVDFRYRSRQGLNVCITHTKPPHPPVSLSISSRIASEELEDAMIETIAANRFV